VPTSPPSEPVLVRDVRLVPVGRPAPQGPVDLRLRDGVVRGVGPGLAPPSADPAAAAAVLRTMRVAATLRRGRLTCDAR